MNNKIEESTPAQVNQSFLEFHAILDRSNPTIAKQLLAGISETDPGDPNNPPGWHQPWSTAIQQISDALQEAGKNWQPNHQRQVAGLVASGLTAWAKAATNRQRAQNPEDILNPQVLLDLPKPALFHRTILADTWQLSSHTRRIAQQLQQNDSRQASYTLMALHTRVHKSIRKETADLERWRRADRDPEINRCDVQRRATIVIAGFINNLWNTDPDLLMELDQAGDEEPTSDSSWYQDASAREALGKILAAFATITADLSPAETEYLANTLARHLALPTTTAVEETEDTGPAQDLEVEANKALLQQDLNALEQTCQQLQYLRQLTLSIPPENPSGSTISINPRSPNPTSMT